MGEVSCARCGRTGPGLDRAPLPGPVGDEVAARACASCWQSWLGEQVKLINETRLSPADPKGFEFLLARMKEYLKLGGEA